MKRNYQQDVESKLLDIDPRLHQDICGYVGLRKEKYPLYFVYAGQEKEDMAKGSSPPKGSSLPKGSSPPIVLLTAGIHGDEPAGVYALLEFIQGPIFNYLPKFQFLVFPCLNPWGFEHDKRENVHRVDINRSFLKNHSMAARLMRTIVKDYAPYLLAINLHEDHPSISVLDFPVEMNPNGFYLYETTLNGRTFGMLMVRTLRDKGIKICDRHTVYGEGNQEGVIYCRSTSGELEQFLQRFTGTILTPETIATLPLEQRVETHLSAIQAALDSL